MFGWCSVCSAHEELPCEEAFFSSTGERAGGEGMRGSAGSAGAVHRRWIGIESGEDEPIGDVEKMLLSSVTATGRGTTACGAGTSSGKQ